MNFRRRINKTMLLKEEVVAVVVRSDAGEWANIVNYDCESCKVTEDYFLNATKK